MKNINDPRNEYQLISELGYRYLQKQDVKDSYQPIFVMHHRRKKTLSYVKVIDHRIEDDFLMSITIKYSDDLVETLNSFALDECLFRRI